MALDRPCFFWDVNVREEELRAMANARWACSPPRGRLSALQGEDPTVGRARQKLS
jgi:hypothetical protein